MFEICKHFFKLHFLLIIAAILIAYYYPPKFSIRTNQPEEQSVEPSAAVQEKLFTKEELREYNGEANEQLYLAILGHVYDVTKGKKHYGQGCAYNFFVGRDASSSFITGEFENFVEEEAEDVVNLGANDLLSLDNWKQFYDKEYPHKGKLIGRFYDDTGAATSYMHKYMALVEQAKEAKAAAENLRKVYPDCNIEWSEEKGTHVWCTTSSGGQERDWIGYPRKLFELGGSDFRCACLAEKDLDTTSVMIKPYDNCDRLSHECYYNVD